MIERTDMTADSKMRWQAIQGIVLGACCLFFFTETGRAGEYSLTNSLALAQALAGRADAEGAVKIYAEAVQAESTNAANLCMLSRRLCDLMYVATSPATQRDILDHALACSLAAVRACPTNSTAHACVAVCYAKKCNFADVKGELEYSRRFKEEAERSLALDPKQDVAYYLLGRWNYGVANVGLVARAYVRVIYGGLPKASNQDAIKNFKEAIALAPDRIINHAGLAMVYAAEGDRPAQIRELKVCRDLKPTGLEDQDAQRDARRKLAELGQ